MSQLRSEFPFTQVKQASLPRSAQAIQWRSPQHFSHSSEQAALGKIQFQERSIPLFFALYSLIKFTTRNSGFAKLQSHLEELPHSGYTSESFAKNLLLSRYQPFCKTAEIQVVDAQPLFRDCHHEQSRDPFQSLCIILARRHLEDHAGILLLDISLSDRNEPKEPVHQALFAFFVARQGSSQRFDPLFSITPLALPYGSKAPIRLLELCA